MRNIAVVSLAALASLAALVCAGYAWWNRPTLSIEHVGAHVKVHTELLGEYPSDIGFVEITDGASARTLWQGVPEGNKVQMHSLGLRPGLNDATPKVFWGRFQAQEAASFHLEPGVAYVIKVCAPTIIPLCQSEGFML